MRFSREHVEVDNRNLTELVVLDIVSITSNTKTRIINVGLHQLYVVDV